MTEQLPSQFKYGYIACRAVRLVPDSIDDANRLPELVPDSGRVTCTPKYKSFVHDGTIVSQDSSGFDLDSQGYLIDAVGVRGVCLLVGEYTVTFSLGAGKVGEKKILLTEAHTALNPLELSSVNAPMIPAPTTVQTILLPGTALEGGVLRWIAGAATWVLPSGDAGIPVTWSTLDHPATFPPEEHGHVRGDIVGIGAKVMTVTTGSTGFSTQPDGTLWVEYTP